MKSIAKFIKKVVPHTGKNSAPLGMISILQQLENFVQFLCLAELEHEDIVEPRLDH